jgi:hypothetical protein
MASELFALQEDDVQGRLAILSSMVEYIEAQVQVFKPSLDKTQVFLVLEGYTRKPRHETQARRNAKALNDGVRSLFISSSTYGQHFGKKLIASGMSRPLQWFNHYLAQELSRQGWSVSHCADGTQADTLIIESAIQGDSVLSSDRDFITFARPNTISRIVFVDKKSRRISCLTVAQVLTRSGLNQDQLRLAYLISGCDDASVKLHQFGWKSALNLLQDTSITDPWEALRDRFGDAVDLLRSDFTTLSQHRGILLLLFITDCVLTKSECFLYTAPTPLSYQAGISLLDKFLNEVDETTGQPRRADLRRRIYPQDDAHRVSLIEEGDQEPVAQFRSREIRKQKRKEQRAAAAGLRKVHEFVIRFAPGMEETSVHDQPAQDQDDDVPGTHSFLTYYNPEILILI